MNSPTNLEGSKVAELAREYSSAGYRVIEAPTDAQMPSFLRGTGFQPDLIANSEHENIVIEVRSRESIRHDKNLAQISDIVEKNEGWSFLLVYTNPRSKSQTAPSGQVSPRATIIESLTNAQRWVDKGSEVEPAATLLWLWSILEAAILNASRLETDKSRPRTPRTLIRDAVIEGLISDKSFEFLERLMRVRNEVAHGNLLKSPRHNELQRLVRVCEEILSIDE
jgi:hypothetical protein